MEAGLAELWAVLDGHAETLLGDGDVSGACLALLEHVLRRFLEVGQRLPQVKDYSLRPLPFFKTQNLPWGGSGSSDTQGLRRETQPLKQWKELDVPYGVLDGSQVGLQSRPLIICQLLRLTASVKDLVHYLYGCSGLIRLSDLWTDALSELLLVVLAASDDFRTDLAHDL